MGPSFSKVFIDGSVKDFLVCLIVFKIMFRDGGNLIQVKLSSLPNSLSVRSSGKK